MYSRTKYLYLSRFELSAGSYVIIPATFEPEMASHFMMRVYSEGPMEIRELRKVANQKKGS